MESGYTTQKRKFTGPLAQVGSEVYASQTQLQPLSKHWGPGLYFCLSCPPVSTKCALPGVFYKILSPGSISLARFIQKHVT